MRALRLGAYDFLEKPCDPARLDLVVGGAARSARAQRQLRESAALQNRRYAPAAFIVRSREAMHVREMLDKLGVAAQVRPKGHKIPATPVGEIVAKHEADFGCQQRSELLAVSGIDIVGDLPDEVQYVTQFSAAVVASSAHAAEAKRFVEFLASPRNAALIRETGLVPKAAARQ